MENKTRREGKSLAKLRRSLLRTPAASVSYFSVSYSIFNVSSTVILIAYEGEKTSCHAITDNSKIDLLLMTQHKYKRNKSTERKNSHGKRKKERKKERKTITRN